VGVVALVVIVVAALGLTAGRFLGADTVSIAELKAEIEKRDRRDQNLIEQDTALQQEITVAEQVLQEREAKLAQRESEFHDATNLTQQEIGQAKQVLVEYEAMRQSRDEAQKLSNQWLMFIWIVSIAAFVLLLVVVVLVMRFWVVISRSRAEAEQRRQVVTLMATTLSSSLNQDERSSLINALNGIAGLPERSTARDN
jgi:hypothetical protein